MASNDSLLRRISAHQHRLMNVENVLSSAYFLPVVSKLSYYSDSLRNSVFLMKIKELKKQNETIKQLSDIINKSINHEQIDIDK